MAKEKTNEVKSLYKERFSGRKFDESRELKAEVGIIPSADGSAIFQTGATKAISVVRGPRTLHPQHKQNPKKGILRVHYSMMPFSVWDRIRPGRSRRGEEISKVTEWALSKCVDLERFPNTVVDVFIQIPQADAGTRVAGINAAVMALAHAGVPMKQMVSAIAIGKLDKTLVVDIDKEEEDYEEGEGSTDIPMVLTSRSKEISLLQLDGKISPDEFREALKIGRVACEKIYEKQVEALKAIGEKEDLSDVAEIEKEMEK